MPDLGSAFDRPPAGPPPDGPPGYLESARWVTVYNEAAEDAPGGALLRVTGSDADGVPTVDQPSADSQTGLLVAHPLLGVPAGGYGLATADPLAPVAYDDGDTPAAGDEWGAASGSWLLTTGQTGYRVAGDPTDQGLVDVVPMGGGGGGAAVNLKWVKITGKTGTGATAVYSGDIYEETAANTWNDTGANLADIVRLPGTLRPDLKTDGDTYVGVVEDPTFPGVYVVVTPGSVYEGEIEIPVEFEITPGSPCTLTVADSKTYAISAPDLLIEEA